MNLRRQSIACTSLACLIAFGSTIPVGDCATNAGRAANVVKGPAAQPPPWHKSDVDELFAQQGKRSPGAVVVGVIDRRHEAIYGFGKVGKKPPTGSTVFETASVSKVFSGLLLAQMIADGKVTASEPVDDVIGKHMPHYGKRPMTLYELATHTSGLPAWPANRASSASPYSTATMEQYLSNYRLASSPGSTMIYSNVGYALLGDALAHKAGEPSYAQMLEDRICRPLGMHDTAVSLTTDMRARLAIGHSGSCASHSSCPTAGGGADGVRSSAGDLLKLLGAYIGRTKTSFDKALAVSAKPYEAVDDDTDSAFGWYFDKPAKIVWKSGRLAGYRTYIAFSPVYHTGVVVLAAYSQFPSPELGKQLLERLR